MLIMLVTERQENHNTALAKASADIALASEPPGGPVVFAVPSSPDTALLGAMPDASEPNSSNSQSIAKKPRQSLRALLVEDNSADVELSIHALRQGGFDVDCDAVQTREEFVESVRRSRYDIVLADYNLPEWNGMEALEILRQENLDIPVVVVSGYLGELRAVECIKRGAADYVLKDHLVRLPESVRHALTERTLREEKLCAQQDLARSNRDLEQFAYVASHDLQEPLRMVAIYTQLLAERYKGNLDAEADRYIHYAVDGATRMQTMVQDLLSFSRVGHQETGVKLTDCNLIVSAALKNLRASIDETKACIECGQLPLVLGVSSELTQLFQNLIGNAINFRGADPPRIRITAETNKEETVFSVADNGIGIAPEHTDTIFVIFKRLHTREEYPGSGIGLAICKKIVERHGGRIWVESESGLGATFRFTLPAGKVSDVRTTQ